MINIHTIHAAQEGDEDAIQQIFESFKQLMIFKTKKYFFHGGDREDVMQEAMIGLLKALTLMMKIRMLLLQPLLYYVSNVKL